MFGSLKLGRVLGIDVYVHGTFWLLPALILFGGLVSGENVTADLLFVFAIFGCVALHELGHAVAAAFYGIRTADITLYPIGGVARLEGIPERPWPEIVVALAGPAVNVAIAALLAAGLAAAAPVFAGTAAGEFLTRLLLANLFLVGFNLIPAFPMDGGRVLRAFLHLFTDRVSATQAATTVGSVFAALMVLGGIAAGHIFLAVIGAMVFLMGRAELAHVRSQRESDRRATWPSNGFRMSWGPRPRPRVVAVPLEGWQWDADRRVWTEYRNGFPVRTHPVG